MRGKLLVTRGEFYSLSILLSYLVITVFFKDRCPLLLDWLGIVFCITSIISWKYKTSEPWFCPYTILILFFVLFNYGIPIMWAFNIHRDGELGTNVLYYGSNYTPSSQDIIDGQFYTCLAMIIFHFGALLIAKRKVSKNVVCNDHKINNTDNDNMDILHAMKIICNILLVVTTPVAIFSRVNDLVISNLYGYSALYYGPNSTQSGYIQIIMYFFFPAIVGYLISNDYSVFSRRIAYIIFGVYTILGILTGERGDWLYSLVILLWLHTYYVKTSKKKYLKYAIITIVGIYLLSVVTSNRNLGATLSLNDFLDAFNRENSPVVEAFFEMGGSMGIIVFLLHTGNGIYPYTNTYLMSFLGVISSRLLNFLGLKQILVADWFSQEYLGLQNWGTGFSMIGEAYLNGGYFGGLIYMFIIGVVHGKIIQVFSRNKEEGENPLKLFIAVAGLNAIIGYSRGALYLTLKELFYGVFVVVILIKILRRRVN